MMKKLISLTVVLAMVCAMLSSLMLTAEAASVNLIRDGGFEESAGLSTGSSWTFKSGSYSWYQYGGGAITADRAAESERAVVFSAGVIGQRVSLESGKKYRFSAQIYSAAAAAVKMGVHDGSKNYPNDNPVVREDKVLSGGRWEGVSMDFECTKSQEYVMIFYNDKKVQMYLDDVSLTEIRETEQDESTVERIRVHSKKSENGQLTYNLKVSSGTQGTLRAALYVNDALKEEKVLRSTTELMTIAFDIADGETSGRTEFTLTDTADNSRELSLPVTDTWNISESASRIELNFNTYPLYVGNASTTNFTNWDGYGSSIDLEATVISDTYSESDLTWKISDSEIASMSADASNKAKVSVKGRRTGYAAVTAYLPDGASASCYIPVIDNYNRFQTRRIVLNADTLTLAPGGSAQLKAIIYPKKVLENNPVSVDESLTWESSDEEIAAVDKNGNISAVSAGTAKITVKSSDVDRTAVCSVTVEEGAQAADISPVQTETADMTVGTTLKLSANVTGGAVYWRSDNSYIADVDQNGVVTAYSNSNVQVVSEDGMDVSEAAGTVKIYATAADGGRAAEYSVRVSDAEAVVHDVKLNKNTLSIPNGKTTSLTAVVTPSKILDKNITWSSDNESVVKVNNDTADTIFGAAQTTLTAVGEGTAYVTAQSGGKSDVCAVTVTNGEIKISDIDLEAEKTIDIDEVYRFTPSVTENATDSKLIWLDTDENIATIDRDGNVMGYAEGTVTVYAVARDSLTADEVSMLEDLKYDVRTIGEQNETLNSILTHAVYKTSTLTVKNGEGDIYLRNLHVPAETITDNSVSLLWNRASLVFAPDIDKYVVYQNGEEIGQTKQMAYTVNGLDADMAYSFKVEAYKSVKDESGNTVSSVLVKADEITVTTKSAPAAVINVLDYGAVGNGLVTDTYAIQSAIDECPEGGVVWLPGDGHIYYSGALFLKSDMTFKVDGVILGSIDPKDYPNMITRWEGWRKLPQSEEEWANTDNLTTASAGEFKQIIKHNHYQNSSLINAGTYDEGENSGTGPYNVRNLTICGEGQINGNGFSLAINEGPNLPSTTDRVIKDQSYRGRTVLIQNAQNVYMKDIMISYSPSWTIHPIYCDSMSIGDIKDISLGNGNVGSGYSVPSSVGHIRNGDGIDPDSCTHMNIYNSYFRNGDDVVTLKSGRNKEGNDLDKPNAYIRVTDCFAHSSIGGFGSGSEVAAGSHDVLFQSLYLESTDCYGIWYKTHPARGGLTENMQARDCTTDGGRSVVRVNYDFSLESSKPAQTINRADNPSKRYQTKARYLTYENVGGIGWTGTNRYTYDMYGLRNNTIHTDKGMPSNISIDHVTIRNADISGNLNCELVKCEDVKIWDVVPNVNWKQTSSANVSIDTSGIPEREKPDGEELVYNDFSTTADGGSTWGFVTNGSGMNDASVDTSNRSILLTNGDSPSGTAPNTHAYQLKTFDDKVKNANKLHILFKYRNTTSAGSTNSNSGLLFTDDKGQIVFAINGGSNRDDHRSFIYASSNGGNGIDAELTETNNSPTYTPNVFGTDRGSWYYDVDLEADFTKSSDNVTVTIKRTDTGAIVYEDTITADGENLKYLYAVNYGNAKAPQRITDFGIYDISDGSATSAPTAEPTAAATAEPEPTDVPEIKPELVIESKNADDETAYYDLSLSTGEDCVIIAASYNADGSLYSAKIVASPRGKADITLSIPYTGADVKLMAWKTLEGMEPAADAIADTAQTQAAEKYIIAEDFSEVSDGSWGFSGSNTYNGIAAKVGATKADVMGGSAADLDSAEERLTFLFDGNSGKSVERTLGKNVSLRTKLNVSFDWQSNTNYSDTVPRNGYFSLMDSEGGYIFSLFTHLQDGIKYSTDYNSATISYNDRGKTASSTGFANMVKLDDWSPSWYHVSLDIDFESGTIKGTVTDRASGEVKAEIDALTQANDLSKLYAYNGYSAAPMSIDNIYIKGGDGMDTLSLESAVNIYSGIDADCYQEYGIAEFNEALEGAKAVLESGSASQARVNNAYRALVKAANSLRAVEYEENCRTIINEDKDWIFVKEKESSSGAATGSTAAQKLDLAEWEGISLPHTWNAQDGSDGGPGGVPDYDRTRSWYRKSMYINSAHEGKELYLEFGGAGTMCELYINGVHVPYANSDIYGFGNSTEYTHRGGFSKFRFDITDHVNYGESNEIAVLVDNSRVPELAPLNGDFNCQGGLYRGVKLVVTDAVHIDMSDYGSDGIYLTPTKVTGAEDDTNTDFTLETKAKIVNDSSEDRTVTIKASLNEPSDFIVPENDYIKEHLRFEPEAMYTDGGAVVKEFETETVTIPANGSYEYKKKVTVIAPRLWNGLADPYRYEVKLSVSENDAMKDTQSAFTGFRYYRIPTPEVSGGSIKGGGFYLNGQPYTLRGAGKHQDVGRGEDALGYAITEENMLSDAGLMYELGMNSVRLVHYQHSNEEIDLYDKLGITAWSEIGVVDEILSPSDSNYNRFMSVTKAQLTELIKQQYNHPSVIVWGLGNEIRREMSSSFSKTAGDEASSPDLATDYHKQLNALAKELDPTRPTTYAAFCLFNRSNDWESDTAAMNLYPYWYTNGMDKWYQNKKSMDGILKADFNVLVNANSAKPLGISEYGGGGEIGYIRPYESDGTVKPGTAYPDEQYTTTYQAYLHEKIYDEIVNKLPWAWCSYVWQLFDSASDKKQGGLPGTNDKGLIKYDHETKKDAFYFYKANWNDIEPFVYVAESETTGIIRAYSNYDTLQLYVNDEPIGDPITDVNPDDGVVDGLGVFMWYDVPEGDIRIEGIVSE